MRILHLETGSHLYGGALQVLLLVDGLQRCGIENVLVVPAGSEVADEALRRGLPCRSVRMAGEADPLLLPRVVKLVRRSRPDLVHLHSRRGADTLGALASRWAGVPVVLTRRVDNPEPEWAVGPKYRLYDRVITISRAIGEVLIRQGVDPEKVRCVHSALDPAPFQEPCIREVFRRELDLAPGDRAIGMAAQFIPRKGHEVLLRAVPAVLREHPRARFLLFGRGPLSADVVAAVRQAGLESSVLFPGFRTDLPSLLPCLDLLVHPALMEGLGIVLLQAGAAGVPVVATRAGGIPEAVVHGETGLLVAPGDSEALAEAMITLLSDDGLSRTMGSSAREHIRTRFSVEAMVEGNLTVYREVLSRNGCDR